MTYDEYTAMINGEKLHAAPRIAEVNTRINGAVVIVSGSRTCDHLFGAPLLTGRAALLFHGAAIGADWLSERAIAHDQVIRRPADWKAKGERAGFIRNVEMYQEAAQFARTSGRQVIALLFWNGTSQGTRHAIACARRFKIRYRTLWQPGVSELSASMLDLLAFRDDNPYA